MKPRVAGILAIITGTFILFHTIYWLLSYIFHYHRFWLVHVIHNWYLALFVAPLNTTMYMLLFGNTHMAIVAVLSIIVGILVVIGGVCALWPSGRARTGADCGEPEAMVARQAAPRPRAVSGSR